MGNENNSWTLESFKLLFFFIGLIILCVIVRIIGLIFERWPLYLILQHFNGDIPYKNNNIEKINELNNEKSDTLIPPQVNITNQTTKNQLEDEFDMKEKCAKYKDNFIQSVKYEYWIWEHYQEYWYNLDDETFVFYSPSRNSCIWAYNVYIINNDQHRTRNIYYKIQDLLTSEVIHDTHQIWDKWWAVQDQSYRNAYLDMVYDLQWYPECYCREMDICRGAWWDWCE